MKLNYQLSKLALDDLEDIWEYTFETWSKTQANRYYKEIIQGIDVICKNPEIGKSIEEIKSNHRIRKVKFHLIVYKVKNNIIFVDRILHERMDIDNILV